MLPYTCRSARNEYTWGDMSKGIAWEGNSQALESRDCTLQLRSGLSEHMGTAVLVSEGWCWLWNLEHISFRFSISIREVGGMTLRFLPLIKGSHVVSDLSPEMNMFTFRSAFQFILFYRGQYFAYYVVIE